MTRMCSMCGQPKGEEDFRKPNAKGKKYCYCKECQRFYMKHYMRIYRERRKTMKKEIDAAKVFRAIALILSSRGDGIKVQLSGISTRTAKAS